MDRNDKQKTQIAEKYIDEVYKKFIESEERVWGGLDDCLEMLEYLDLDQLYRESMVLNFLHDGKKIKCPKNHDENCCLVPRLVAAADCILEGYRKTGKMSEKHQYVLQYYLALHHVGFIIVEDPKDN